MIYQKPDFLPIEPSYDYETIAAAYDEAFEQGFNVTTREIMDYLSVSDQWVYRNIADIKFRVINRLAKQALRKYGHPKFKHLHAYTKIFDRRAFHSELLRNSFIEVDQELHTVTKLPQKLISCAEACELYGISRNTFYRRTRTATKYHVYDLKKYSAREIEHILLDSI
ncbi:helix-turn-helix domain-containing protein [Listeria newyorkensis]|uniref:helix-turn-helix domain-containing protein n=1 Tax=Listeria newyorkensis TaxID=1497681 RepID=UPI0010F6D166|nr:helix-turn-helix domain-containing protein [Listeria newyorkensis]